MGKSKKKSKRKEEKKKRSPSLKARIGKYVIVGAVGGYLMHGLYDYFKDDIPNVIPKIFQKKKKRIDRKRIYHGGFMRTLTKDPNEPKFDALEIRNCKYLIKISENDDLFDLYIQDSPLLEKISECPNLENVIIRGESRISVIDAPNLKKLNIIGIENRVMLEIKDYENLVHLEVSGRQDISIRNLPSLKYLNIYDISTVFVNSSIFHNLTTLLMYDIHDITSIDGTNNFNSLTTLKCYGMNLLESIVNIPSLVSLGCVRCFNLWTVDRIEKIETLVLRDCHNLTLREMGCFRKLKNVMSENTPLIDIHSDDPYKKPGREVTFDNLRKLCVLNDAVMIGETMHKGINDKGGKKYGNKGDFTHYYMERYYKQKDFGRRKSRKRKSGKKNSKRKSKKKKRIN